MTVRAGAAVRRAAGGPLSLAEMGAEAEAATLMGGTSL